MVSSVKAGELLLLDEDVTDSRVRSPARLTVVDGKLLLPWMSVWTSEDRDPPSVKVADGGSWRGRSVSVCIQETASLDTAGGESDPSFQFSLLVSVMIPAAEEVSCSGDSLRASTDLGLISV